LYHFQFTALAIYQNFGHSFVYYTVLWVGGLVSGAFGSVVYIMRLWIIPMLTATAHSPPRPRIRWALCQA